MSLTSRQVHVVQVVASHKDLFHTFQQKNKEIANNCILLAMKAVDVTKSTLK